MSREGRRDRDDGGGKTKISLLVRNLPLDARPDEIRVKFEKYGRVRDVYLPRDYYSGRPKGFGFVEFLDVREADDAIYHLDRTDFMGREITVIHSRESRKTPNDMLARERDAPPRGGSDYGRRGGRSRSRSPSRDRRRRRSPSRSRSGDRRHGRSRSRSPGRDGRRRSSRRSPSRSPVRTRSPPRPRSRSPAHRSSRRSLSRGRSPRSRSPPPRMASRSPKASPPARSASRSPAPGSPRATRSASPARSASPSPKPMSDDA
ncbi:SRS5 [Auxenochlorella protothecoides x Auxenochlorella symbiontica]